MRNVILALAIGVAATGCTKQQFAAPSQPPTQAPVQAASTAALDVAAPVQTPSLVALDVAAANRFVTAGTDNEVLARITVRSESVEDQARFSANLALVIDTSASMRGDAINHARDAALAMVDALKPGDRLSVITFHSRAEVLVPSTEITQDTKEQFRKAIGTMEAVGTTALTDGLAQGLAQVAPHMRQDAINRVVLLSDGVPNNESTVRSLATQAASQGIGIAALGLGIDYHEALLAELASRTGGRFHFVEDTTEVATMFRDEVLHIDRMVAAGASLALRAGPGVTITEVVGRPHAPVGTSAVTIPVGDLAENEAKEIVVRLAVGSHRPGATVELLDATVRYADATTTGETLERNAFLAVGATDDQAEQRSGLDLETELLAAKAVAASDMLKVIARARTGDVKGAVAQLAQAEKDARSIADKSQDADLIALADELSSLRKTLPSLAPPKPSKRPSKALRRKGKGTGSAPRPQTYGLSGGVMPGKGGGSSRDASSLKRAHSQAFNALH